MFKHQSREKRITCPVSSPNFHSYHLACVMHPIFYTRIKWKSPLKHLAIHLSIIYYVPLAKFSHFFDIYPLWETIIHHRYKQHWRWKSIELPEALAISPILPFTQAGGVIYVNFPLKSAQEVVLQSEPSAVLLPLNHTVTILTCKKYRRGNLYMLIGLGIAIHGYGFKYLEDMFSCPTFEMSYCFEVNTVELNTLISSTSQNAMKRKRLDEKMLNIISHQGTANQNHCEIALHLHKWLESKSHRITVTENVEKVGPSYTAGGNEKWCSHLGKQSGTIFLKMTNMELPCEPAIPLLSIYSKRRRKTCPLKTNI